MSAAALGLVLGLSSTSGQMENCSTEKLCSNQSLSERMDRLTPCCAHLALLEPSNSNQSEKCNTKEGTKHHVLSERNAVISVLALVLFLLILIITVYLMRRRFAFQLAAKAVLMCPDEIIPINIRSHRPGVSMGSTLSISTNISISRSARSVSATSSIPDWLDPNCVGKYKGEFVILRQFSPTRNLTDTLKRVNLMYSLRHENINPLIGMLNDVPPNFHQTSGPFLVWTFASRGSLHSILLEQNFKMEWILVLSLIADLVKGMNYLHGSSLKLHGQLNPSNCVIDNRWILKITDYGLNGLNVATSNRSTLNLTGNRRNWIAPEYLNSSKPENLSQASDVYCFGMILKNILQKQDDSSNEIMNKACDKAKSDRKAAHREQQTTSSATGSRPNSASYEFVSKSLIDLVKKCMSRSPRDRPNFKAIDSFIAKVAGKKSTLLDKAFLLMERYSKVLETQMSDRVGELGAEQLLTDQLLSRMLPVSVSNSLKAGIKVEPEHFDDVTVYFSDIVGFTTISAYSEPIEIINLLNDLYTAFDETIDKFNVYKVETIGDAYMVVGGLPFRRKEHAEDIADMALNLLHVCGNFKIRHLPGIPLFLRIGIHTGPVVAGVVGNTMPRYCLFGDTVNTASRIESTGEACRIHLSKTTESKLRRSGKYIIEYRGEIILKGRGTQSTFWLTGKAGFDLKLPAMPVEMLNEDLFVKLGRSKINQLDTVNPLLGGNRIDDDVILVATPTPPCTTPTESMMGRRMNKKDEVIICKKECK